MNIEEIIRLLERSKGGIYKYTTPDGKSSITIEKKDGNYNCIIYRLVGSRYGKKCNIETSAANQQSFFLYLEGYYRDGLIPSPDKEIIS